MKTKYKLPDKFVNTIVKAGETSMGWTCVRVETVDKKIYKNVLVHGGHEIIGVYGYNDLPFKVEDIKSVIATHREDYPSDFKRFYTFEDLADGKPNPNKPVK